MGKTGFRAKSCVRVLWSEKSEHVCVGTNMKKQNKTKQNEAVTGPVSPLQMSFLEPRVPRSVYVPYSAAHSPTASNMWYGTALRNTLVPVVVS